MDTSAMDASRAADLKAPERNSRYCLPSGYRDRENPPWFDDRSHNEQLYWQRSVYELARSLAEDAKSIVDYGCGTGHKLDAFFSDHGGDIVGVDSPDLVPWLIEMWPAFQFLDWNCSIDSPDLLICADVVEHVEDPLLLLQRLRGFSFALYSLYSESGYSARAKERPTNESPSC